jgi:methyl-accepting chemotaxis protein
MDSSERRTRIRANLGIEAISHGQVYTFQIAIPESEDLEIPLERRENLKRSLTQQGSNLIPLIVRRTEAYSEEEEYEVVDGADWCLVAKELDIEKLWVWVFDMTDEQAAAAKEEMQQLLGSSDSSPVVVQPPSEETESIKPIIQKLDKLSQQVEIINKKVETLTSKVEQVAASVKKIEANQSTQINNQNKLESLTSKVEQLTEAVKRIENLLNNLPESTSGGIIPPKPTVINYDNMTATQLKVIASERNIMGRSKMKKPELIAALKKADASN